jgi:hypothetical protein
VLLPLLLAVAVVVIAALMQMTTNCPVKTRRYLVI